MRPDVVSARTYRSAPRGRRIFLRKTSARQLVEDEGFRESAQRIRRGHGCSREEPRRGILRTGANRDSTGLDAALFTHGATTKPRSVLVARATRDRSKMGGAGRGDRAAGRCAAANRARGGFGQRKSAGCQSHRRRSGGVLATAG